MEVGVVGKIGVSQGRDDWPWKEEKKETVERQETVYFGIKNRIALGTVPVHGGLYYVQRLEKKRGKGFC